VSAADTGRPLRRALVTVTSLDPGVDRRTMSTNAEGRYEISDLPAGRYTIAAWRSGHTCAALRSEPAARAPRRWISTSRSSKLDYVATDERARRRITMKPGSRLPGLACSSYDRPYIDGDRRLGASTTPRPTMPGSIES
jgi:hypothetical protein